MNEKTEWKVYAVDDCDWYMARNPEEAIAAAVEFTGLSREDIEEDGYPRLMTDEEMEHYKYRDEDGAKRTFTAELALRVATDPKPQLFASTEI